MTDAELDKLATLSHDMLLTVVMADSRIPERLIADLREERREIARLREALEGAEGRLEVKKRALERLCTVVGDWMMAFAEQELEIERLGGRVTKFAGSTRWQEVPADLAGTEGEE